MSLAVILPAADPTSTPAAGGGLFGFDPTLLLFAALAAVLIFFMWRNSRKQRAKQEELRTQIVPGAEVMTQQGIYGTLVSIDQDKQVAVIETTPGTQLRVHPQSIARVVEEQSPADDADSDSVDGTDSAESPDKA